MTLSEKVYKLDKKYKQESTEILDNLERNHWEIIQRVYHYRSDTYMECSDPDAIFWQIVTQFLDHYAKLLDLDVKDLKPKGLGDTNFYQAWILRRKLHNWFQQKGKISGDDFGVFMDDLIKNVASFGSYIVKINRKTNEPELADLRRIAFDPTVKTIRGEDKAMFHHMTKQEIKEMDAWNNHKALIENAYQVEGDKYEIWDYHGWVKEDGEYIFKNVIGSGLQNSNGKGNQTIALEVEMEEEDDPYYDIHLGQYEGMWLRKGIYEKCFHEQWRANELVNHNAQATEIASLLLLRSNDSDTHGNVLQQAVNGQIINSKDLQQIDISNKAFTQLLNELEIIQNQVREKLGLPDIATGETLPSGTPFRGMALMSSAQKSAFKQRRSRVSTGIVNIVERIMPELVREWNRGDVVEIAEDIKDVQMYDEAVRRVARKRVYQKANERGVEVTDEIEQRIQKIVDDKIRRKGRKIKTPKKFFDFDYGIYIDPVGEFIDKGQQNDAIINALKLVLQNPAIVEISAFNQLLENNNIPPFKIKKELEERLKQGQEQEGKQAQVQKALEGMNRQSQPSPTNQTPSQ